MSEINSFRDVIELWGPKDSFGARQAMAAEVGASASIVTKWWQRETIPADWWAHVLAADRVRAAGVTAELLTQFAAREVPVSDVGEEARA